jgi:hypothetical protein
MAVSDFIFNVWACMANYNICINSRVFIPFQSSMANRFILCIHDDYIWTLREMVAPKINFLSN